MSPIALDKRERKMKKTGAEGLEQSKSNTFLSTVHLHSPHHLPNNVPQAQKVPRPLKTTHSFRTSSAVNDPTAYYCKKASNPHCLGRRQDPPASSSGSNSNSSSSSSSISSSNGGGGGGDINSSGSGSTFPTTATVSPTSFLSSSFPPPSISSSTITPTASSSSSPSSTPTRKPEGQSPITSLAVQLILVALAIICFGVVFARCMHVGRRHKTAAVTSRQRNLDEAQARRAAVHEMILRSRQDHRDLPVESHLAPTNRMTLAGRLNLYQTRSGVVVSHYPYHQDPVGAAAGGRNDDNGLGHVETIQSFIAPSYEQDVSPPSFMAASGKPPTYTDALRAAVPIPHASTPALYTRPPSSAHDPTTTVSIPDPVPSSPVTGESTDRPARSQDI